MSIVDDTDAIGRRLRELRGEPAAGVSAPAIEPYRIETDLAQGWIHHETLQHPVSILACPINPLPYKHMVWNIRQDAVGERELQFDSRFQLVGCAKGDVKTAPGAHTTIVGLINGQLEIYCVIQH